MACSVEKINKTDKISHSRTKAKTEQADAYTGNKRARSATGPGGETSSRHRGSEAKTLPRFLTFFNTMKSHTVLSF